MIANNDILIAADLYLSGKRIGTFPKRCSSAANILIIHVSYIYKQFMITLTF